MDFSTFAMVVIIAAFVLGVYSTRKKRSQIYCRFISRDKTVEEKWVTVKDDYVIFRNYKFDILPERFTSFWLTKGIHYLFPTRVNFLAYTWKHKVPLDPDTGNYELLDPATRKLIDKNEWVKSYSKNMSPQTATAKQSVLMRWLPLIGVVLFVIVGFYLYQNQQSIMSTINAMQQQMNAIPGR